jgi:hypothetical protein
MSVTIYQLNIIAVGYVCCLTVMPLPCYLPKTQLDVSISTRFTLSAGLYISIHTVFGNNLEPF